MKIIPVTEATASFICVLNSGGALQRPAFSSGTIAAPSPYVPISCLHWFWCPSLLKRELLVGCGGGGGKAQNRLTRQGSVLSCLKSAERLLGLTIPWQGSIFPFYDKQKCVYFVFGEGGWGNRVWKWALHLTLIGKSAVLYQPFLSQACGSAGLIAAKPKSNCELYQKAGEKRLAVLDLQGCAAFPEAWLACNTWSCLLSSYLFLAFDVNGWFETSFPWTVQFLLPLYPKKPVDGAKGAPLFYSRQRRVFLSLFCCTILPLFSKEKYISFILGFE